MTPAPLIRMTGIVRRFGALTALDGVDLELSGGEVHALLGENGAGKTTLMHVLFGVTAPDAGSIEAFGRVVRLRHSADAIALGFGMVHQHFTQVPRMSVAENVLLGFPGLAYRRAAAQALVRRIGDDTGLALDPAALAEDLPVGLRQRLEIIKALAREVRLLILDEPTAALAPSEVDELFAALARLRDRGIAIVLITHKLHEALQLADRITVLRRGAVVHAGPRAGMTPAALGEAMIGHALAGAVEPGRAEIAATGVPSLTVRDLVVGRTYGRGDAVSGASLTVRAGEIVGIAAVEGNGQRELLRAVAGLLPFRGQVSVAGGVGFVPEDRHREGLILDFTIAENLALGGVHPFVLDRRFLEHEAVTAVEEFAIAGDQRRAVRTLSGGNQQKVVLARALGRLPSLLVAENPTRGLDFAATMDVHGRIRAAARRDGLGVLFYSSDLDEVLALADRVGVMRDGVWHEVPGQADRAGVGALMLGRAA